MNKIILAVCFMILTLYGFGIGYIAYVTELIYESYIMMFAYYYSLAYILAQFAEKPESGKKESTAKKR